jgi:hypothetical protein
MTYFKLIALTTLLSGIIYFQGYAQIEKSIDTNNLKSQATIMMQAFTKPDYKTFVSFTYPRVVEMMGGVESMIKFLEKSIEQTKAEGFTFQSVNIGSVTKGVVAGNELHALVQQQITLQAKEGIITANSYLLAISKDSGKNWTFVDAANLTREKIEMMFPDYNYELKIPEKQAPIFTQKQ